MELRRKLHGKIVSEWARDNNCGTFAEPSLTLRFRLIVITTILSVNARHSSRYCGFFKSAITDEGGLKSFVIDYATHLLESLYNREEFQRYAEFLKRNTKNDVSAFQVTPELDSSFSSTLFRLFILFSVINRALKRYAGWLLERARRWKTEMFNSFSLWVMLRNAKQEGK